MTRHQALFMVTSAFLSTLLALGLLILAVSRLAPTSPAAALTSHVLDIRHRSANIAGENVDGRRSQPQSHPPLIPRLEARQLTPHEARRRSPNAPASHYMRLRPVSIGENPDQQTLARRAYHPKSSRRRVVGEEHMTYGPFRGEQEHRTHRRRRSGGRATDQGELWQEERGNGNTMIRRRNKPPSPPAVPDRIHGETRHVASPMSLVTSPVVGYRQPRPRRPPLDTSPAAVRKHGVDCRDSGTNSASRYEDARELARRDSDDSSPYGRGYGVAVTTNVWDLIYTVDMMIGTQVMPMEIDTGSSDTWVVGNNFSCVFPDLKKAPIEFCAPAATFAGSFSGGWRNDTDFRIMYVSGEFMRGRFGYEDVEIAGITVRQQQVALVTLAYTNFGGALGGVLGLGFPLLTSDPSGVRKRYDPIVTTMIKQGAVSEPMFSVALSRNFSSSESFIAFGGMPPVAWDESTMVSVPVLNLELISSWPEMETEPSFFTIVPDGWVFGDAVGNVFVNKTRIPVIVDTGATFTRLPTDMAHLLYSLYSPPAAYYEEAGHWVAPCNATTPTFGVEFAGRVFYMHRQDLLNEHWGTEDLCLVGIQDAGKDYYVMLGQSWLHNVVSVFDVGQLEMRFAARYYR